MEAFTAIQDWVIAAGASPFALLATYLLCTIDGFFPPLPSESIVIALAALTVTSEGPHIGLLWAVAALGAFTGDQIAYTIGARIPVERIRYFSRGRGARAYARAGRALLLHGPILIMSARFIPVGRVAVNLGAGAIGYPRVTFSVVDAVSASMWAAYSVAIGIGAAHALDGHPLLAVLFGVAGGVALGAVISQIITVVQRRYFPERYDAIERAAQEWTEGLDDGGD
ncbi:DedA family protein [Flaviflexus huanghaiensis]|uniref:DedA family protein n=1 Tax=Flaviflexus huanghaiensis TaxID=1111473 RepID=UPI0015F86D52|nr:VTT domain-containing protein [Flaviflexus huanghaiensis]